jgi:hypothetical protein
MIKVQFYQSAYIDQCSLWLKVWGIKETWFFWLLILNKVAFFTKFYVIHLMKKNKLKKIPSRQSMA